jgi:hypothetical protein
VDANSFLALIRWVLCAATHSFPRWDLSEHGLAEERNVADLLGFHEVSTTGLAIA